MTPVFVRLASLLCFARCAPGFLLPRGGLQKGAAVTGRYLLLGNWQDIEDVARSLNGTEGCLRAELKDSESRLRAETKDSESHLRVDV